MKAAEKKAAADGFSFSGCWYHRWETERIQEGRDRLKEEGYKVRTIQRHGGTALFVKDTPKTIAAEEERKCQAEEKRLAKAFELRRLCEQTDFDKMTMNQLGSIERVIREEGGTA